MGNEKQRIIPAHYSWNSSIFTRGVIDPIKRKLGWVDENERPVSLKESATGQEWDRVKDTAKGTGKLVATGLTFSNPVTASAAMAPLITGSQAYFMTEGLKDAYDRITSPNKTAADGVMVALDVAGAVPAFNAVRNGYRFIAPEIKLIKSSEPYNFISEVIKHPRRSIQNFKTINGLEDGFYTGIPHKQINGSELFMDENFPNYNGTIWTSDNIDYARSFSNNSAQNGKIYKVLFPKSQRVLETPEATSNEFFGWNHLPFTKTNSGYRLTEGTITTPKYFTKKESPGMKQVFERTVIPPEISRRYNKVLSPEEIYSLTGKEVTTTDRIVDDAIKNGYQRVHFNDIMDGGSVTKDGHWYDDTINENVLLPHTPHFILHPEQSKWSLLPKDLNKIVIEKQGGILKRVESGKSGIHIKPENRGKFTALKKRTGKSSTWYKEHGTPAQKKMAVFALNARKWKHK